MITVFDKLSFSAQRRGVLDTGERELLPQVEDALAHWGGRGWFDKVLNEAVPRLFAETFRQESGDTVHPNLADAEQALHKTLAAALAHTGHPSDNTAEVITRFITTATVNAATKFAAETDEADLVLEWVTMHDNEVRATHKAADGQRRPVGETFDIGGAQLEFPGDPSGPIDEWINCRCVLRPDHATANSMAASAAPGALPEQDAEPDGDEVAPRATSSIVALPTADHPVNDVAAGQTHVTLADLGDADSMDGDQVQAVKDAVANVANNTDPYSDPVSGRATLGPHKADALLLDGHHTTATRRKLMAHPAVADQMRLAGQHPNFIPHATVGYPADTYGDPSNIDNLSFDRLALWHGDDQTEYPLGGGSMTAAATDQQEADSLTPGPLPWHGVLAPMGVRSGDGRMFANGGLRNRDLPLPLTYQKASADGHDGSVVVGRIDNIFTKDNLLCGEGVMLQTPEADEAIGMLGTFGKFGVSVDIDDASFDMDEQSETLTFTDARVCSASMVSIPAFAEAFVALGGWPQDGSTQPPEDVPVAASAEVLEFDRGPGWETNPKATQRIHDYWTVPGQPGFDKIAWGTEGDFDRCRAELGEEIGENSPDKLVYLNQICAQWQHDAIGVWPGKGEKLAQEGEPAPSVSLVASAGWCPPAEWFADPGFTSLQPLRIIEHDGKLQVRGHLSDWTTCHIGLGMGNVCVTAPHSKSNYAYFKTGEVLTDAGPVAIGNITLGGGHAAQHLSMRGALAHYESTSTVVADVNAGEDEHGIWVAGYIRERATHDDVVALRAASLSGDWRRIRGNLELITGLAVNAGGFPIPRVGVEDGVQVSLVAAGIIPQSEPRIVVTTTMGGGGGGSTIFGVGEGGSTMGTASITIAPTELFINEVAIGLKNRELRQRKLAELGVEILGDPKERIAALAARVDGE